VTLLDCAQGSRAGLGDGDQLGAPPIDRARALLYTAELAIRTGDTARAHAEAKSITLAQPDQDAIAAELSDVAELLEV